MYGTVSASGMTGGALAMSGLAMGATLLTIIGLAFATVALIALVRPHKGGRP